MTLAARPRVLLFMTDFFWLPRPAPQFSHGSRAVSKACLVTGDYQPALMQVMGGEPDGPGFAQAPLFRGRRRTAALRPGRGRGRGRGESVPGASLAATVIGRPGAGASGILARFQDQGTVGMVPFCNAGQQRWSQQRCVRLGGQPGSDASRPLPI